MKRLIILLFAALGAFSLRAWSVEGYVVAETKTVTVVINGSNLNTLISTDGITLEHVNFQLSGDNNIEYVTAATDYLNMGSESGGFFVNVPRNFTLSLTADEFYEVEAIESMTVRACSYRTGVAKLAIDGQAAVNIETLGAKPGNDSYYKNVTASGLSNTEAVGLRFTRDTYATYDNYINNITLTLRINRLEPEEYDCLLSGAEELFEGADVMMEEQPDGTFTYTLVADLTGTPDSPDTYAFSVEKHTDDWSERAVEDGVISIDLNGKYEITITYDPSDGTYRTSVRRIGWATGVNEAETKKAQKIVRDGQIVIVKDGKEYNVLGIRL